MKSILLKMDFLCKKYDIVLKSKNDERIAEFKDKADWLAISKHRWLSQPFIRFFQDKIYWHCISIHQNLTSSFIMEFKNRLDWGSILKYQVLSEKLIQHEFGHEIAGWHLISEYQKLSEAFIERFKDHVSWMSISIYQKLSEAFIAKHQNKVYWSYISSYQKLSENFIRKFKCKVEWRCISKFQKLSEAFIEEHKDLVHWSYIEKYQKLSEDFRKKYNLKVSSYNWLYKSEEEKLNYIKNNTDYKIIDNKYIIAYKTTRANGYSVINFQLKYEVGKTYESNCDTNNNRYNSFGLSAWTKEKALNYYKGKLFKVRIDIDDLGCIVPGSSKIRCFKLKVLEEIPTGG